MTSAFGIEHDISKAELTRDQKKSVASSGAGGAAAGALAMPVRVRSNAEDVKRLGLDKIPVDTETQVPTKSVTEVSNRPGRRVQNRAYMYRAASDEKSGKWRGGAKPPSQRPTEFFRTKDGSLIQSDGAHAQAGRALQGLENSPIKIHDATSAERPTRSLAGRIVNDLGTARHKRWLRSNTGMDPEKLERKGSRLLDSSVKANAKLGGGNKLSSTGKSPSIFFKPGPSHSALRGKQAVFMGGGAAMAGGATYGAAKLTQNNRAQWTAEHRVRKQYDPESPKNQPRMSDTELRTRRKVQSATWKTGGGLGLLGAGLGVTAITAGRGKGLRAIQRVVPSATADTTRKLERAALYTGITGGGIGGASSFNSAAISGEEARRMKVKKMPVQKNSEPLFPDVPFGVDEGIAKEWTPLGRDYDPEKRRMNRMPTEEGLLYGGGVAGAGTAFGLNQSKKKNQALAQAAQNTSKKRVARLHTAKAKARGRGAIVAGALGAGSVGAGAFVHRQKNSGAWNPY
jgi:hypothetical protein